MRKKYILPLIFMLLPFAVFSQNQPAGERKPDPFPAQMQDTDFFSVNRCEFNTKVDPQGRGELLEVDLELINNLNVAQNLYIFVIASYDQVVWKKTSFGIETRTPERIDILNFVPFQSDKSNFEYQEDGKTVIRKFPVDFKKGVDPETGKPYLLDKRLYVRTEHLSPYRQQYYYFNHITIMVYDEQGKSLFRQFYEIKGRRR